MNKKYKWTTPRSTIHDLAERAHESLENAIMWENMEAARGDHPVLKKNKIITGFGARRYKSKLVIAFFDCYNHIALLFVGTKGEQQFKGNVAGKVAVTYGEGKPEYMTVDYLSAASVSQMTFKPCLVSGTSDNLEKAAEIFPDVTIVVDNATYSEAYGHAKNCNRLYGNKIVRVPEIKNGVVTVNDFMKTGANISRYLGLEEHIPRFRFMSIVLMNPIAVRWLIHGFIRNQASVMMIYAPSHSGKTYVILDMMLKIAFGFPDWFGHKIHQANVLYFCGEGVSDVHERTILWLQQHGKSVSSLIDRFAICQDMIDLDNEEEVSKMVQDIKTELYGMTPGIIAIDTMSLYMAGDENNTQDANRLVRNLKRLAMLFNCCIVLIHHTSKSNEDVARGNGTIKAALDTEILVKGSNGEIEVRQTKNRGMKLCEAIWLELEEHEIMNMIDVDTGKLKTNAILVEGEKKLIAEEPESTKHTKLDDDIDFLVAACINYAEVNSVFREIKITRDNLASHGSTTWNTTTGEAKKKLNPHQEYKPLWRLLTNGILEETEHEKYTVKDDSTINRILAAVSTEPDQIDGFEDYPETEE